MTPPVPTPLETIEVVAILRTLDSKLFSLPRPARHNHIIDHIIDTNPAVKRVGYGYKQGFITSTGRFVDRAEGYVLARLAGQIVKKHGAANVLYSEDMW
jgi:hypothetical protein